MAVLLAAATLAPGALAAPLDAGWFRDGTATATLIDNAAFLPSAGAQAAAEAFEGVLVLGETTMLTEPAVFKSSDVLGGNPQVFPGVTLGFATDGGYLVPAEQGVIRYGSIHAGKSFWDVIVQPGTVWSEPGDDGWSRASFPLALVHSIEGETHNGVGMFLYRGEEVSDLRVQITQQTSPFYVEDYFLASARVPMRREAGTVPGRDAVVVAFRQQQADEVPILPWSELAAAHPDAALDAFNGEIADEDNVLGGIAIDGKFYLKSCATPYGELPYCDRQRFGVWSVTKSAADSLALLHLAQKYGPEIYGTKFVDLVPEAAGRDGWEDVALADMVNMTSGMARPDATEDEEPWDASYYAWYEAPTVAAKLDATLSTAKPYAWGPGARMRYRDEDIFLLGVAMTRYLQAREGPEADVWTMLEEEVFRPIGIHVAPTNKTIEADGSAGQPLMAFGYYPTIGDLVKIARLYQDGGRHGDAQLLDADRVAEILSNRSDLGFETGGAHRSRYLHSFWRATFASRGGCEVSYPSMVGWGDNFVSLFPQDVTVIRLAKDWDGEGNSGSSTSLETTVDQLVELCGN